jgi:hypothetical protein
MKQKTIFTHEEGVRQVIYRAIKRIIGILLAMFIVWLWLAVFYLAGGEMEVYAVVLTVALTMGIGGYFIVRAIPDFKDL